MSSLSCRLRRMSSSRSTTVTSLASSRERLLAALRPTCPAPRMTIFTAAPGSSGSSQRLQILNHHPFRALLLEIDLHPGRGPIALHVENHALAELPVADAPAEAHA